MAYYSALGLRPGASDAEVQAAFRNRMGRFHPDASMLSSSEKSEMQLVNEAFNVLRDKDKRLAYDLEQGLRQAGGSEGSRAAGGSGPGPRSEAGGGSASRAQGEFWERVAKPWRSWQGEQNVQRWRHQFEDKWQQASKTAKQASGKAQSIDWSGVEKQGRQGWEEVKKTSNRAWQGLRPRLQSLQTPAGRARMAQDAAWFREQVRNSPEVLEIKRNVQHLGRKMEHEGRLFVKDPKGRALRAQRAITSGELRDRAQAFAQRRPGAAAASAALAGMVVLSLFR